MLCFRYIYIYMYVYIYIYKSVLLAVSFHSLQRQHTNQTHYWIFCRKIQAYGTAEAGSCLTLSEDGTRLGIAVQKPMIIFTQRFLEQNRVPAGPWPPRPPCAAVGTAGNHSRVQRAAGFLLGMRGPSARHATHHHPIRPPRRVSPSRPHAMPPITIPSVHHAAYHHPVHMPCHPSPSCLSATPRITIPLSTERPWPTTGVLSWGHGCWGLRSPLIQHAQHTPAQGSLSLLHGEQIRSARIFNTRAQASLRRSLAAATLTAELVSASCQSPQRSGTTRVARSKPRSLWWPLCFQRKPWNTGRPLGLHALTSSWELSIQKFKTLIFRPYNVCS